MKGKNSINVLSIIKMILAFVGTISFSICVLIVGVSLTQNSDTIEVETITPVTPQSYVWTTRKDAALEKFDLPTKWGSFRPGYYFSLKSKTPLAGMISGLMWSAPMITDMPQKYRHETSQDELTSFDWLKHNGATYGVQRLIDGKYNLELLTSFVIPEAESSIPRDSADLSAPTWIKKIDLKLKDKKKTFQPSSVQRESVDVPIVLYFSTHCADEYNPQACLELTTMSSIQVLPLIEENSTNTVGFQVVGQSVLNGWFVLTISANTATSSASFATLTGPDAFSGGKLLADELSSPSGSRPTPQTVSFLDDFGHLSNTQTSNQATFLAFQLVLPLPISAEAEHETVEVLVAYKDQLSESVLDTLLQAPTASSAHLLLSSQFAHYSARYDAELQAKIAQRYPINANDEFQSNAHYRDLVQTVLSSLIGGMGYFAGRPRIGANVNQAWDTLSSPGDVPASHALAGNRSPLLHLLTATPSRTSFPRGFLWDEGFHQMVLMHYDVNLTLACLSSWLQTMQLTVPTPLQTTGSAKKHTAKTSAGEELGWIPREMILGREAESRVPDEFIVQRMNIANPPTFFLVLQSLLRQSDKPSADVLAFLQAAYPRLKAWLRWFVHSQGSGVQGGYRWRGRDPAEARRKLLLNTLASGLDDYPRARGWSEDETHVDLLAWLVKAQGVLQEIEGLLGLSAASHPSGPSLDNLNLNHWVEEWKGYYDTGLHNDSIVWQEEVHFRCVDPQTRSTLDAYYPVPLVQARRPFCPSSHPQPMYPLGGHDQFRLALAPSPLTSRQHVPRLGYNTLYPLLLTLLSPNSDKLGHLLDQLADHLLTPYGLRSLAPSDPFYWRPNAPGDAPYWRGPIWMNVNYLALSALHHYKGLVGPYQARCDVLYSTLRSAVLRTVLGEFDRTGWLWEQYDDHTGEGIRGHPFTGWTATIVNIFYELY